MKAKDLKELLEEKIVDLEKEVKWANDSAELHYDERQAQVIIAKKLKTKLEITERRLARCQEKIRTLNSFIELEDEVKH